MGASSVAHSLNILLGILFRPEALPGFKFCNNFSTPVTSMFNSGMLRKGSPSNSGGAVVFSCENTDLSYSFRISACWVLSDTKRPRLFKVEMPVLSCFLLLIHLQNGFGFLVCTDPSSRCDTCLSWAQRTFF